MNEMIINIIDKLPPAPWHKCHNKERALLPNGKKRFFGG